MEAREAEKGREERKANTNLELNLLLRLDLVVPLPLGVEQIRTHLVVNSFNGVDFTDEFWRWLSD